MEEKELPEYRIEKAKLKGDRLTVEYLEIFRNANFENAITKECRQIVHGDLKLAFDMLKPHVAAICEMPEAKEISVAFPREADMERLKPYLITGYSKGGSGEHAGVTVIAQKLLKIGKTLNLCVPFVTFEDQSGNGYGHAAILKEIVDRCDYEVDAYLFEEKWGIGQQDLFSGEPFREEIATYAVEAVTDLIKPKKRGRKTGVTVNGKDLDKHPELDELINAQ